jgi:hypothetical protein
MKIRAPHRESERRKFLGHAAKHGGRFRTRDWQAGGIR